MHIIWLISDWCGISLSWIFELNWGLCLSFAFFFTSQPWLQFISQSYFFPLLMFWVIKRVSIHLFSMAVSLAQRFGEIGAFYNNTLAFSDISIFHFILSLPYRSIFCRLHLINLLFLIISLVFNGTMFFNLKI